NRPPSYNAMQYYDEGGQVPNPEPSGGLQPGDIPAEQFVPDLASQQQSSDQNVPQPGDIADSDFTPDDQTYGTPSQLGLATLEQGAQGFAGTVAPYLETNLGLT